MDLDLVDSVLGTPNSDADAAAVDVVAVDATTTTTTMDDGNNMVNDEVMQVRTMDIPLWLSTLEVTSKLSFDRNFISNYDQFWFSVDVATFYRSSSFVLSSSTGSEVVIISLRT
mmetsp:Transcript_32955/g.71178  ORF Transcript_32955/g.71178 Transcript_32955/m.71178 type:complete len:114 (-) Transcript_32955:1387-1728(-)